MTDQIADFDRRRAEILMRAARIDALVLFQPENFGYAIGAPAGVAAMWRRPGGAIAVMPADRSVSPAAIVGDLQAQSLRAKNPALDIREHPLWVDTVDVEAIDPAGRTSAEIVAAAYRHAGGSAAPRPTTFDLARALAHLADILSERGLAHARIGADLGFLPVADFEAIKTAVPHVDWVDGSDVIRRLRAIKTPREIDRLRRACRLAEAGLVHMSERIAPGQTRADVAALWRDGVAGAARSAAGVSGFSGSWDYVSVGPDPWSRGGVVEPGAIIKADVGCLIDGYSSDTARTYVFGTPAPIARDIHAALLEAFEIGIAMIGPGVALRDVHAATTAAIHRAGYRGYGRGHFGHGLGASVGSEEWPFIAADSDVVAEPGMVLAFETPFYGKGIGALMIEDQMLVTNTGIELMVTLPRTLVRLG